MDVDVLVVCSSHTHTQTYTHTHTHTHTLTTKPCQSYGHKTQLGKDTRHRQPYTCLTTKNPIRQKHTTYIHTHTRKNTHTHS